MYDTGKVTVGLLAFLALASGPFWYTRAQGSAAAAPVLPKPAAEQHCVEPVETMRASHMDLLDDWRDAVVRRGERVWVASDGARHPISLTGTCLRCHGDQTKFCDRCHAYVGAEPTCWDCHVGPEGTTP